MKVSDAVNFRKSIKTFLDMPVETDFFKLDDVKPQYAQLDFSLSSSCGSLDLYITNKYLFF